MAQSFSFNAFFWMPCKKNGLFYIFYYLTMISNRMVFILPLYYVFQTKVLQISQNILQLTSQMAYTVFS